MVDFFVIIAGIVGYIVFLSGALAIASVLWESLADLRAFFRWLFTGRKD